MSDNPNGTYWPTWTRAVACAGRRFEKNETFTDHQFHEKCGIDYDTATKYLPLLVGRDLGAGKKILSAPVATKNGYVVDPPGQDSLELARLECCGRCRCDRAQKQDPFKAPWMIPLLVTFCLMLPAFFFISSRAKR